MSLVLKVLVIVICVQNTIAGLEHFHIEPDENDDIHILADFLKLYVGKIHGKSRRHITIQFSSASIEQRRKQIDLIETLIEYTKGLYLSYSILKSEFIQDYINNYRGLEIMLIDDPYIFR